MGGSAPAQELRFAVGARGGEVSALWLRPAGARHLLVLAHGAGAGMRHPSLEALAARLADHGVASFRYAFPYMEAGSRRPDPPALLIATVRAAVAAAARAAPELPLLAGGRSMGGRMTTLAAAQQALPGVCGIALFAFPLHPAGRPGSDRAQHLADVRAPMLFLSGTRDTLAELSLLRGVCDRLGARAVLHVLDGADHSFRVLKRSGRSDDEVLEEAALAVRHFADAAAPARDGG